MVLVITRPHHKHIKNDQPQGMILVDLILWLHRAGLALGLQIGRLRSAGVGGGGGLVVVVLIYDIN